VWNAGGGTLSYAIADVATWFSCSPASGSSTGEHDTITVTYATAGLSAGTHTATITVADPAATNSPQTVAVSLTVIPPPTISLSQTCLAPWSTGGADAAAETFEVWNAGDGTLSYTITDDAGWLSCGPASGDSTGEHDTITVTYATSGLAVGTHAATITIADPAATNSPQAVAVTLRVYPAGNGYRIVDLSTGAFLEVGSIDDLETNEAYKTTHLVLKRIPSGTFQMGDEAGGGSSAELPVHTVNMTQAFYMGVFEVTQEQWTTIMGPWSFGFPGNPTYPAERVSWNDINGSGGFMNALSSLASTNYRLPTEAEWEYCGKAGTSTEYSYGDVADGAWMWYSANGASQTHEVGSTASKPNPWGLYDMHGNVWEWCEDWHSNSYYQYCVDNSITDDPPGPASGFNRVQRGGSWGGNAFSCRSTYRGEVLPSDREDYRGFRVVSAASAAPTIELNPTIREPWCTEGADAPSESFEVRNSGNGTLSYTITDDAGWLSCSPSSGSPTGEHDTITVTYATSGLAVGTHTATITVTDPAATNSPQTVAVTLRVAEVLTETYVVVDLSTGGLTQAATIADLETNDAYKTTHLVLRRIPAGTFEMGDQVGGHEDCELPVHTVNITHAFYMGVFEVTQEQWTMLMGSWSFAFSGNPKHPAELVTWDDIKQSGGFMDALFSLSLVEGRLPTEAEWEYCGKAGTSTNYSYGDAVNGAWMWYLDNSDTGGGPETHEVGTTASKPNPWGLYDMHGNVREWCEDWFGREYYASSPSDDPPGPASMDERVCRGGAYGDNASACRSASRNGLWPDHSSGSIGFRVAVTAGP
jgi:formylglycine-generating enzyme required for sulfatase activity